MVDPHPRAGAYQIALRGACAARKRRPERFGLRGSLDLGCGSLLTPRHNLSLDRPADHPNVVRSVPGRARRHQGGGRPHCVQAQGWRSHIDKRARWQGRAFGCAALCLFFHPQLSHPSQAFGPYACTPDCKERRPTVRDIKCALAPAISSTFGPWANCRVLAHWGARPERGLTTLCCAHWGPVGITGLGVR